PDTARIISLMCNSTSENSKMNHDACYGCFSRALYNGQDSTFAEITNCVTTYMSGKVYQSCVDEFLIESCTEEVHAMRKTKMDSVETYIYTTACILTKISCRPSLHEPVGNWICGRVYSQNSKTGSNQGRPDKSQMPCQPGQTTRSQNKEKHYGLFVTGQYDLRMVQLPHGTPALACVIGTTPDKPINWGGEKCNTN
ncbi:hypothetical protein L9F63_022782, partial [Diploptera punctata]